MPVVIPRRLRSVSEWLLVAALLAVPRVAGAQAPTPVEVERIALEAEELIAASAGVWSMPLRGPLLFVDRGTRRAIGTAADSAGVLTRDGGVFAGTLPEGVMIANAGVDWNGVRWTMLMWPLPSGPLSRRVLLGHEMFHAIQPVLGMPGADAPAGHLDEEGARVWLRLEWRALQAALVATGGERRDAIRDALAFRALRHARYPDGAVQERRLELNEGLAEYTGVRVAVPALGQPGWVARHLDDHHARVLDRSIVRNFAYASGPAYGVLLDAASADWRARITADADLGELLREAYRLPRPALDGARATARARAYGGDRIAAEEAERARAEAERQAAFRARFETGPTLTLPVDDAFGYSFDPNAVASYGDVGLVYRTAEVTAGWGRLVVTGNGVLMLRRDGMITGVVVPAPAAGAGGAPIEGDGWTLHLADGWRLAPGERAGDVTVTNR